MLLLWGSACRVGDEAGEGTPLLDGGHVPDVLVERRTLEPPASFSGNRFLRGWWPRKRMLKRQWYAPAEKGAVLEIVTLGDSERRLTLSGRVLRAEPDARVTARAAAGEPTSLPLAFPLEIPLPAGLPLGRSTVELDFPPGAEVMVDRAWLDRALPAGAVELGPAAIRQQPASAVDLVRRLDAGAELTGVFEPPAEPRPGQRFRLLIEREGQPPRVGFEWRPGGWDRFTGHRPLSVALDARPGPVRIRLLAEGSGAAATWRDLRLVPPERTDPSPPPPAPPPQPRLVVVYVLDALRADAVDLSGAESGPTPEIARLAREGVTFVRHHSVAPNTIPSTKSLFTGQPFLLRGDSKLPATGPPTLAELFADAGFRTATFSGNGYVSDVLGTTRGFGHVAEEVFFRESVDGPGAYNDNAERVQRSALAWLDGVAPDEPAFLYLHTIHPHNPYDPPDEIAERYTAGIDSELAASTLNLLSIRNRELEVTAADRERIRALYRGSLAYNDALLGELVRELVRRVPPGELLLVVTSDHGEELFDHGGVLHGYTLHRELLEIPLILWWPGRLEPRRVDVPTSNLDLHESLRALVGAGPSGFDLGRSLWDLAEGTAGRSDPHRVFFAAASSLRGGIFSARSQRWKLILAPRIGKQYGMGEGRGRSHDAEYFFDLEIDPAERTNIAGNRSLEAARLRSRLLAWIERGKLLEADAEEPELDEETEARLRALGYLD